MLVIGVRPGVHSGALRDQEFEVSKLDDILGPLPVDHLRVVFLYVGQGESTLVFIPDGDDGHHLMLVDCNRSDGATDVAALLENVCSAGTLDVFVNTHPHSDHLGGLGKAREKVTITNVWHSGHRPGPDHDGPYQELADLVTAVKKAGGEERKLLASRSPFEYGSANIHVLSPAEYVTDDIEAEKNEERYKRIHEQCAVVKISYGTPACSVLVTGDADKTAWKRITEYHGKADANRMAAQILSAVHHGSYTFFKDREDDEDPYFDHLTAIAPSEIVVSAPDQKDSKHDHPNPWAMEQYEDQVGAASLHHMGSRAWAFFVDISPTGTYVLDTDRGAICEAFTLNTDDDGGGDGSSKKKTPPVISRVERSRPMG